MVQSKPENLLNALCANAHPRTAASLRLIYGICQEQSERGSQDFSVATIGRLSSERGGPSAGAIRNKTGEKYRALIAACAEPTNGRSRKRLAGAGDEIDEVLEGIADPVLRTRVGLMQAELRSLRGQILALRKLAAEKAVLEIRSQDGQGPHPGARLSDQQRRALKDAISKNTLTHWGWVADKSGRVVAGDTGQIVFTAGYVSAIEKVLESM